MVIPCYNEAARLPFTAIREALESNADLELVFVDDGSTDRTGELLRDFARSSERVRAVAMPRNSGKAEAVRYGLLEHAFKIEGIEAVGFWDADMATPLSLAAEMMARMSRDPECWLVFGSRIKMLGTQIDRNLKRHLIGRAFATLTSVAVDLGVYDTQCGAKIFRASPQIRGLFETPFISPWLFDVELLARLAQQLGWEATQMRRHAIELPVPEWRDVEGSKVKLSHFPRLIADLSRITARYRLGL